MGLKLGITPNVTNASELTMTFLDTSANSDTYDPYKLILVDLNFNKQMYQPCEINARIQITVGGNIISLPDLQSKFLNAKVSLSETESQKTIASNYYVQELVFEKSTTTEIQESGISSHITSLYAQFMIFSLDKLLTLKRDNRTFVAKRLAHDILKDEAKETKLPYNSSATLGGDSNSLVKIALRKKLVNPVYKKDADGNDTNIIDYENSDEYIQPYLVQHDESFYDMLIRTANRWGEFVYFENGCLVIGCDSSNSGKEFKDGYSITYKNDVSPTIRDIVTNDDYLEVIKKDDYIKHAGDLYAKAPDPVYAHKATQSFVNMSGSMWEWMTDRVIDDNLTYSKNDKYLKKKKKEYNDKFFKKPLQDTDDALRESHYNTDSDSKKHQTQCRQFATFVNDGGLTSTVYQTVLSNELTAGKEELCIDLGVNYQHLLLGHIITVAGAQYLVTRVECTVDKEMSIEEKTDENNNKTYSLKEEKQLHYHVYAVKEVATGDFYPPMLPTGHVRFSNPLRGVVVDTMDPKMQWRYRVTNNGKSLGKDGNGKYISKGASPWICVSHEMLSKGGGSVWQLEAGTEVLLDFKYGNVELPFIAGVLQNETTKVTRHSMFNNMSYQTPAGHAVRLTDGYGAGAANFIADFIPFVGLIKGFFPEGSAWHTKSGIFEDYLAYEGGVELTDKYGVYSIKASTDERNISIKSPYGDVTLNAFTGITISAPNGNVKIQGKNVSIEAGNNLTLISGKNIEKGFLGSVTLGEGMKQQNDYDKAKASGSMTAKYAMGKAASFFDLPLLRHTWEVILRPVAGVMELRSHRAMKIHAGINAQATTDEQKEILDITGYKNNNKTATELFEDSLKFASNDIAQMVLGTYNYRVKDDQDIWGNNNLCKNGEIVFERKSNDGAAQLDRGGYDRNDKKITSMKYDVNKNNPGNNNGILSKQEVTITEIIATSGVRIKKAKQQKGDVTDKLDATHEGFV